MAPRGARGIAGESEFPVKRGTGEGGAPRGGQARTAVFLRVSSSLLGPVDPSFRALSGRLKFTVRRHKFNKDSLLLREARALEGTGVPRS